MPASLPAPLLAPLVESDALPLAQSLMAGATCDPPDHVQISRNIPPWPHQPGGPHIDGLTPPEPDGRPGTFTMLAGIFLTDQTREDAGNLWVWPGSHRDTAGYLLGHNMGGNVSDRVREVLYLRLRRSGHRVRWREAVQDPLLEFEAIRPGGG